MTSTDLTNWLKTYGQAWETRNPDAAAALFTEDATYYETPFGSPEKGRVGIRQYWDSATRNQRDIKFSFRVIVVTNGTGIARWWVEFTRESTGVRVKLDGIFLLDLDETGLCRELREWWHRADLPQAQ